MGTDRLDKWRRGAGIGCEGTFEGFGECGTVEDPTVEAELQAARDEMKAAIRRPEFVAELLEVYREENGGLGVYRDWTDKTQHAARNKIHGLLVKAWKQYYVSERDKRYDVSEEEYLDAMERFWQKRNAALAAEAKIVAEFEANRMEFERVLKELKDTQSSLEYEAVRVVRDAAKAKAAEEEQERVKKLVVQLREEGVLPIAMPVLPDYRKAQHEFAVGKAFVSFTVSREHSIAQKYVKVTMSVRRLADGHSASLWRAVVQGSSLPVALGKVEQVAIDEGVCSA